MRMDIRIMHQIKNITITPEILKLIADIDESKSPIAVASRRARKHS